MLEIENLGKGGRIAYASITNKIQEITTGSENKLEKIDSITKGNLKYNISLTQNILEISHQGKDQA